ncbi:MAG: polymer-forming cytoskeletal protein [Methylovulum sp.]|nr:polymer-forming cytoskeletal protein [Methylovulum sp.]
MWKREPATQPENKSTPTPAQEISPTTLPRSERILDKMSANIGKSVIIKGELNGSEDLLIEGQIEGKIDLKEHLLTIGQNGRIHAEIHAKAVVVQGQVVGNIVASERVMIRENGSVVGDIVAPRVSIAEGAIFKGKIDMQGSRVGVGNVISQPMPESLPKPSADAPSKKDKVA